ncbi:MAG: L-aspartate oxidase [Spirochaetota bacterium]|nr:L-aspartate oxidase [Spirochaetota bacterium]
MSQKPIESDVLIIGSGIAGCCCALSLADKGQKVTLLSKMDDGTESNTKYAQGGIVSGGEDDSPEQLIADIMAAADGLGHEEAVRILANEGPKMVSDFLVDSVGVQFTKDDDGNILFTSEAAHSARRVWYVMDHTGKEIINKLINKVKQHPNITLLTNHMAIDLITTGHHSENPLDIYLNNQCLGAYVYNSLSDTVTLFFARKTVLATGGVGNLFLHTSNPGSATGDGLAMAYRAGTKIINAEYIQFHPTTLFHRDANRFLITESLRGEGARLKNLKGDFFMENYDPQKDLAPRDIISRAIYEETHQTEKGYVLLDLSPLVKNNIDIPTRYPTIFTRCQELGMDIRTEPIPVVPAAHYFCGGIQVDLWGQSSLQNLYAIGEVSCTGIHGANRLASVSLLEGLVWGLRAAENISHTASDTVTTLYDRIAGWKSVDSTESVDPILIYQDWLSIRSTMWNYAGIVRTKKRLTRANSDLGYLKHRIESFYRESRLSKALIELRNGILSATLIVQDALRNTRSMGCHYRKD